MNDLAHVLTAEDLQALNEQVNALEKTWSVQMAVVLVRRLPDDMDIADFARDVGRKWHVGINDSGLVYVASISQRKQRLEVSTHLEGIIPDLAARAIADQVKPFFRDKDYAGGLEKMVSMIHEHLEQAQAREAPVAQPSAGQSPANDIVPFQDDNSAQGASWFFIKFIILGFWGFGFFIIILRNIFSGGIKRRRPEYFSATGAYVDNNVYIAGSGYSTSNTVIDAGSSGGNDFGNWGGSVDSSSSSDPGFSSSDPGFSGGGASSDW